MDGIFDPLHTSDIELLGRVMMAQKPFLVLTEALQQELLRTWRDPLDQEFVSQALSIGPTLAAKIHQEWQAARAAVDQEAM